ncbi:MAG: NusG domain II-containing protein [Acholeplasmatales bacterium]|nr:NusG domain II-containing protein [Acholeplasmatales bacterium]
MNHKIRNDIILISSIVTILVTILLIVIFTSKKGKYAEVRKGDEVIMKLPLDEDKEYIVEGKISPVKIVVKNGGVYVAESGCPDKICMDMGTISKTNDRPIFCAPNEILIVVVEE